MKFFPEMEMLFILTVMEVVTVYVFNTQTIHFIYFVELGLELRAYTLSHSTSPFCMTDFFEIGSCPGWLFFF
jgi:hypothetical protein